METYQTVLLANEPGTYRSLLAEQLPFLRPDLHVVEVQPGEIDAAMSSYQPAVVISSRHLAPPPELNITILVLYPEGDDTILQTLHGAITAIRQPRLSDILAAIDRAVLTFGS
jgi:hypothetical protein